MSILSANTAVLTESSAVFAVQESEYMHTSVCNMYDLTSRCRIDNLIYAPDTTDCVLALLDWELSTLGYPLADLAYSAMCYHFPSSDKTGVRGLPRPLPEGTAPTAVVCSTCTSSRSIQAS